MLPWSHATQEVRGNQGDGYHLAKLRARLVGTATLRGEQGKVVGCFVHPETLPEAAPRKTFGGTCTVFVAVVEGGHETYVGFIKTDLH